MKGIYEIRNVSVHKLYPPYQTINYELYTPKTGGSDIWSIEKWEFNK